MPCSIATTLDRTLVYRRLLPSIFDGLLWQFASTHLYYLSEADKHCDKNQWIFSWPRTLTLTILSGSAWTLNSTNHWYTNRYQWLGTTCRNAHMNTLYFYSQWTGSQLGLVLASQVSGAGWEQSGHKEQHFTHRILYFTMSHSTQQIFSTLAGNLFAG